MKKTLVVFAATAKAVNYTPEQTVEMVNMYTADKSKATVETLAKMYGKTARSIVAKLSREKVYVTKEYKTKTGDVVQKKDAVADAIGAVLGLEENDIESLTKATKPALQAIFKALANSKPIEG